jgi:hypothetical protein
VATLIPARFQEGHAAKITGFVAAGVPGELVMAAGREVRGARRNGSELPLEVGLNSATMADGSVEIIAAVQDVTERKRNQIRTELLKAVAFAGQEDWTMDQILGRTLRQICETVSWPIGHIYLWDDARQRLVPSGIWHVDDHVKARVGAFQAARAQAEFEPGKGLPGRVYETGQGAWIEDIALDPNFPRLDLMPTTDLHAAFAIPVQLAGQTRAVLEFFDVNVVPRDPDLVVVMDAIGRQLGRALDRRAA